MKTEPNLSPTVSFQLVSFAQISLYGLLTVLPDTCLSRQSQQRLIAARTTKFRQMGPRGREDK